MKKLMKSKWRLAINTLPYIIFIAIAKYTAHYYEAEFLTLNALFTAIISANIFLIGFLISGTLSDYKESERLPGEIAGGKFSTR
jgi:Na+/H+-dicarboxylate symporter